MKVYLAGEREIMREAAPATWAKSLRRRLFSYYYNGAQRDNKPSPEIIKTLEVTKDLFLDSGAFSAFTQGAELDLDQYAEFLHTANIWTCASNLDSIEGDSKLTYSNQKALESLDCKIQPVFHCREDISWLKKYLDEGYDYIFLGGMVPETTKYLHGWLDNLWEHYLTDSEGVPIVKVHGFGLTTIELMFKYPWYSVDSSTWLMNGIFGSIMLETDGGTYVNIRISENSPTKRDEHSRHYTNFNKRERSVVDAKLKELGVTAKDCMESYYFRDIVNANTFQNFEKHGITKFRKAQMDLFDV